MGAQLHADLRSLRELCDVHERTISVLQAQIASDKVVLPPHTHTLNACMHTYTLSAVRACTRKAAFFPAPSCFPVGAFN